MKTYSGKALTRHEKTHEAELLAMAKAMKGISINCASFFEAWTLSAFEELEAADPAIKSIPEYSDAKFTIICATRVCAKIAAEKRQAA